MKNRKYILSFIYIIMLGGCSLIYQDDELPNINFLLEEQFSRTHSTAQKVTLQIVNAGPNLFMIINNGSNYSLDIDSIAIAGDKCTYSTKAVTFILPKEVRVYKLPEVGLIGLCYMNAEQILFIERTFLGVRNSKADISLPMKINAKYKIHTSKEPQSKEVEILSYLVFKN